MQALLRLPTIDKAARSRQRGQSRCQTESVPGRETRCQPLTLDTYTALPSPSLRPRSIARFPPPRRAMAFVPRQAPSCRHQIASSRARLPPEPITARSTSERARPVTGQTSNVACSPPPSGVGGGSGAALRLGAWAHQSRRVRARGRPAHRTRTGTGASRRRRARRRGRAGRGRARSPGRREYQALCGRRGSSRVGDLR